MKYEDCYSMILNNFRDKINVKDNKVLNEKVFNSLLLWYEKNFEDDLKRYCKDDNKLAIINIFNQIEDVCKLNDYEKMQVTYEDKKFNEFLAITNEIYDKVIKFIKYNLYDLTDDNYCNYVKKINDYENEISKLFIDKYKFYRSEVLLDLDFLKNKGNVQYFSIRTSRILNAQK